MNVSLLRCSYSDICQMLLDADASCVNVADNEGDTPLHNAARGGHEEVARLLVARGADATLKNEVTQGCFIAHHQRA